MIDFFSVILTIMGLAAFEVITSVDNAVINSDVLRTMSQRGRHWFLTWGVLVSVFLIRGLLPLIIVWSANPMLEPINALSLGFNSDPAVLRAVNQFKPILLMASGVFLVFLFLQWLFMEDKSYGLKGEEFIYRHGLWFYTAVSIFLAAVAWFAIQRNPLMGFSAVVGSTAYFIVHGFRRNAEAREKELINRTELSDLSKIIYLEVIDATFSIDGVLGAFAFTLSVPLIVLGSGLGAVAVRHFTAGNIETVKKYRYLKNGAMYSILLLGVIMLADSFGVEPPEWLSPIMTFMVIGYFFWKSAAANRTAK